MKMNSEIGSEKAEFEMYVSKLEKCKTYEYTSDEIILKKEENTNTYTDMETGEIITKKELLLTTQQIIYKQFNLNLNS